MPKGHASEIEEIVPAAESATLQDTAEGAAGAEASTKRKDEDEESEPEEDDDEEALAEKFSEAFNQIDIDSEGSEYSLILQTIAYCLPD
jgi:hypothetical protein